MHDRFSTVESTHEKLKQILKIRALTPARHGTIFRAVSCRAE